MGTVVLERSTRSTHKFARTIGTAMVEFATTVAAEGAFKTADHGNAIGRKRRFTPFAGLTHLKHRSSRFGLSDCRSTSNQMGLL